MNNVNLENRSQGYIYIWRRIMDKAFYADSEYFHLWMHLLLTANHTDKIYKGVLIKRGQLKTGRKKLKDVTGINESKVERILGYFKDEQQIEQRTTNRYRIITIKNYDKFQNYRQQTKQQRTTNKQQKTQLINDTNDSNEKKDKEVSLFWDYYLHKTKKRFKLTEDRIKLIQERIKDYSLNDLKKAVDNFVNDEWLERKDNLDLIYCIGKQPGKPDNLEKWLNKPKKKGYEKYLRKG